MGEDSGGGEPGPVEVWEIWDEMKRSGSLDHLVADSPAADPSLSPPPRQGAVRRDEEGDGDG